MMHSIAMSPALNFNFWLDVLDKKNGASFALHAVVAATDLAEPFF